MKKGYVYLLVLLILVLGLFVYGCRGNDTEEPGANGEVPGGDEKGADEEPNGEEEALPRFDNLKIPETVSEIINTFSEFRLNFDGDIYEYLYLGSDAVDGVDAEKISVSVSGEEIIIWVAADESVIQAEKDGQIISSDLSGEGEHLASLLLMPFMMAGTYNVDEYTSTAGFSVRQVGSSQEKVGDLSATVYTMEIKMGPPVLPEEYTYIERIADLGDFQIVVSIDVFKGGDEKSGTREFEFELEELSLR